ncbi:hypothetical protein SAICODRAFT_25982 [Saitoella complicata NRRL Y-17804]|uniref:uncharacterized protein n=1 Tax=Saitoella complicata (strain BCRC 22490 / CBS 7301 / JCM 7358 / NBRC 10748 / NRRL Y-17804) TaxID=698492 RepID=UPI0008675E59|nr:uncharacterized protein SAICODRAFT_25982 [Saitoella complicata NRRL Y-17804]ODQ52298.1 hypothetical protein SAICODRAFT_25982 [Saitoella complicata NRRL Y-17804]
MSLTSLFLSATKLVVERILSPDNLPSLLHACISSNAPTRVRALRVLQYLTSSRPTTIRLCTPAVFLTLTTALLNVLADEDDSPRDERGEREALSCLSTFMALGYTAKSMAVEAGVVAWLKRYEADPNPSLPVAIGEHEDFSTLLVDIVRGLLDVEQGRLQLVGAGLLGEDALENFIPNLSDPVFNPELYVEVDLEELQRDEDGDVYMIEEEYEEEEELTDEDEHEHEDEEEEDSGDGIPTYIYSEASGDDDDEEAALEVTETIYQQLASTERRIHGLSLTPAPAPAPGPAPDAMGQLLLLLEQETIAFESLMAHINNLTIPVVRRHAPDFDAVFEQLRQHQRNVTLRAGERPDDRSAQARLDRMAEVLQATRGIRERLARMVERVERQVVDRGL